MKNCLSVSWFIGLCLLLILTSSGYPSYIEEANTSCISYISSAISPNGDGINDHFRVEGECEFEDYSLQILNNAWEVVYTSYNSQDVWEGLQDGTPVPNGRYNWIIEYKLQNGEKSHHEGELILIR